MEHREAELQNVAARYMAGELTTFEREEFELHYFDCAQCADSVRSKIQTTFSAAAVVHKPSSANQRASSSWMDALLSWRPSPAGVLATACVALLFTSYEALRAHSRLAPQPVTAYHLLPDSRGSEQSIESAKSGGFVVLTADLPETVQDWKWQIRNLDNGGLMHEGSAATSPGGALSLLMPLSRLTPARYVLSVRDGNLITPEITYRFRMH